MDITDGKDLDARFKQHLPRSHDLTLLVLKGHLLVEEQVDRLLESLLQNPSAFKAVHLRFPERLQLIRALLPMRPQAFARLFEAAEQLNTLRNRLAHHLDPPQLQQQMTTFLRKLEGTELPRKEITKYSMVKRVRASLSFLAAGFAGICDALMTTRAEQRWERSLHRR